MYKKILVPVDGTRPSGYGLQEAIRLAKSQKATLRLVHVVNQMAAAHSPGVMVAAGDLLEQMMEGGRSVLEKAKAVAARAGVRAETALHSGFGGGVANPVAREARRWRADLIVMGTHGRSGIGHVFLGSEAEEVVKSSPVPVLLVRTAPRRKRSAAKR